MDALSAERRPLPDVLRIQGLLQETAAQCPLQYGELAERCCLPTVGRTHAIHLLGNRHLGEPARLTDRELEVLAAIATGWSNTGIAERLSLPSPPSRPT